MWQTLIKKHVLDEVHDYRAVDFESGVAPRGKGSKLPENMYHPRPKMNSIDMKNIIGFNQRPSWVTCNPTTWSTLYSDAVLLKHCHEKGSYHLIGQRWFAVLISKMKEVVLRLKDTDVWYFCVGDVAESVFFAWRAVRHNNEAGTVWFTPAYDESALCTFVCLDLDLWEVLPIKWLVPVEQYTLKGLSQQSSPAAMRAFPQGEATPVLEAAAKTCFQGLSLEFLRKLAKHVGVEVPSPATKFKLVTFLMQHILTCSEQDVCDYLIKVDNGDDSALGDIMEIEEVQDMPREHQCSYSLMSNMSRISRVYTMWRNVSAYWV